MTESELGGAERKEPKVIKRYTNRKLYDTVESRYVTLEEISEMIKAGTEVKIIDNRTKEDLTSVTLAQIIFEQEKKKSRMPLGMLRDMVRHGGETVSEFFQQQVGPRVASLRENILGQEGPIEGAKEMVAQSQRALEEWQKRVDERVHQAVENVASLPALGKDLAALDKRIAELEQKLDELEERDNR